jgi:dihydroflavonol-4-reductase
LHKALITGATGLVGFSTARELLKAGRPLRAAVRNLDRARQILPEPIELVEADVCDAASMRAAMQGCQRVFHCAGLPEQWLPDPDRFQQVNVEGTRNLVEVALELGVEKFVYTSTIDVFAAEDGAEFDERVIDPNPKGTHYERSKQEADRVVVAGIERGLPAVFVHPAAVYGPGPAGSRGVNDFFADLRDRKIPGLLPGGMPIVYGPDLGRAQLLVEESEVGSRYILCDRYYTLEELATLVAEVCPEAKVPMILPTWVARVLSAGGETFAKVRKKPPLIPKGQLHFLLWGAKPQSARAEKELGWSQTPTSQAIAETMEFLGQVGGERTSGSA